MCHHLHMKKKLLIAVVILLLCVPVVLWYQSRPLHTDINGPVEKSQVPDEIPLTLKDFETKRSPGSLALVVVDSDSRWPDLISVLKTHGIQVSVYQKLSEAKNHKVIFIYPAISGRLFTAVELEELKSYVKKGGNLIATNVLGGGLQEVFGFRGLDENNTRKYLKFGEQTIQFSSPEKEVAAGSVSYTEPKNAIASFEDGRAAVLENKFGKGNATLIGIDVGNFAYLSSSNRLEGTSYPYLNDFVSGIDPLMKYIKSVYRKYDPNAVTLGTVPHDKDVTILMTHDVDFRESVAHALAYAREEDKLGIKATFFVQTKYVHDFGDEIFFRDADIRSYRRIKKLGMEIASHSVSHSLLFHKFGLGNGKEIYPNYRPYNVNWGFNKEGTILGELRVSKFLLDSKLPKQETISFRSGNLRDPQKLPQALMASGYKYDSSGTTGMHLTNFPIRLTYNRRGKSYVNVFRFPVTVEDEKMPPLLERMDSSNKTCEEVAKLKAVCTILVHPNIRGHKLDYVLGTIKYWKDRAYFSTVGEFGDWWSTRDQLKVSVAGNVISIESVLPMKGLPLELPDGKTKLVDLESGMNKFDF